MLYSTELLHDHAWAGWKGIELTRWSDFTSMFPIQSICPAQGAKICNFWHRQCFVPSPRLSLHRRPTHDWRQRGCGKISLGKRIKGWEVTLSRKRRDVCAIVFCLGLTSPGKITVYGIPEILFWKIRNALLIYQIWYERDFRTRQSKLCETQKAICWAWWICEGDGWEFSESVDTGCHEVLENIWVV